MLLRLRNDRVLRLLPALWAIAHLAQFAHCSGTVLNPSEETVVAIIGREGGTIRLPLQFAGSPYQEATLVIPPDALPTPTRLTMRNGQALALVNMWPIGPAVEIQPEGLRFQKPAVLRLPFDPSRQDGSHIVKGAMQTADELSQLPVAQLLQPEGAAEFALSNLATLQVILTVPPGSPMFSTVTLITEIDNSLSMTAKQRQLAESTWKLFKRLADVASSDPMNQKVVRVGVTDTDVGENYVAGTPDCGKPQNRFDNGRLQIRSCRDRLAKGELSAEAGQACLSICDAKAVLPTAAQPYIEYDPRKPAGKQYNVGDGSQAAAIAAYQCMALVGDNGCNIEGPLRSMQHTIERIANHEYGDFLPLIAGTKKAKKDALLAVLFITDEDDCSVKADRMRDNQLATRSCPSGGPQTPDCFNIDYRCIAESLVCKTGSMLTPGSSTQCSMRPNSYLDPPSKYFHVLNNLVDNINNVVVAGIWTLPTISNKDLIVYLPGTKTPDPNQPQAPLVVDYATPLSPHTSPSLHHSYACKSTYTDKVTGNKTDILGYSQLRLSQFACYIPGAMEVSICDLDQYGVAIDQLINYIDNKTKPGATDELPRCTPP